VLDVRPVVLVHGVISSRYLLPTVRELARFTRVLVPDLPGVGRHRRSSVPAFAHQADAVAEAIMAWGGSPVILVGHSLGAEVVVEVARRHPALVQRAVLIGPTGDPAAGGVFGVWKRWMSTAVSEPLAFNLLTTAELARIGPMRMAALLRRSVHDPVEAKLSDLRCAALLIRGERDRVAPATWLERMGRQIPDACIVTLAGSAHTVVYTDPRTLADLVLSPVSCLPAERLDGSIGIVPSEEPGRGRGSVVGCGDVDERRQDGAQRLAGGTDDR
jgi:pimeloyl-ACP methyl ester carboxylesterase